MAMSMVPHEGIVEIQKMEVELREFVKVLEVQREEAKNENEYNIAVMGINFHKGARTGILSAMEYLGISPLAEPEEKQEVNK